MIYRGIIFDLDGTLANTLDDIATSMNKVLAAHGYPVRPVNDYKLLVGRGLDNLVRQSLPFEIRTPELIGICLTEMMEDYSRNCLVKTCLYDGVQELLNELIRLEIKMSVFSNKAEQLTLIIVKQLMPDIPFMKVMGARHDYPKKPDPAGALFISNYMGIDPREIIYMGDSDVDMMTANRAGMFAAGVSWGFRDKEELQANGANVILNYPKELLEYL